MHVTLKKAAALAHALSQVKVGIYAVITLSKFDEIPDLTPDYDLVDDKLNLIAATYIIRDLIGKANEGRINHLITMRAATDKMLEFLNGFEDNPKTPNLERIQAEQADPKSYGTISVKIPYDLSSHKKKAKRERLKIEDELATLNYQNTIELPEDVVALLVRYDLV